MIDGSLLGGDFNEVLQASEKRGGLPASARKCALFQNRIDSCRLMDLYAIGHISSHGEVICNKGALEYMSGWTEL